VNNSTLSTENKTNDEQSNNGGLDNQDKKTQVSNTSAGTAATESNKSKPS